MVFGYGVGFGWSLPDLGIRRAFSRAVNWLKAESEAAIAALEDIFDGVMYGGSILLVLVFFGYFIQKFTEAGNITDIYALPVFGNIIKSIADALGIAGSLVMIAFLLAIMVPVIILVTRLTRKATTGVSRD